MNYILIILFYIYELYFAFRPNWLHYNFTPSYVWHSNNLILAIQVHIDKVKNAILFLKIGIVDPYFVSPQELLDSVQLTNLGYNLTLKDISIINSIRKPITIVDDSNNQIIIIFNFPVANPIQYNLFENLIIPKHSASGTVVLKNIPKYFASSFDNIHFLHFDSLDGCEKLTNSFICKSSIVLESGKFRIFFIRGMIHIVTTSISRKILMSITHLIMVSFCPPPSPSNWILFALITQTKRTWQDPILFNLQIIVL